jgi:hypothetical protein
MGWENRNLATRRFNLSLNQEDAFVLGYFGVSFEFSGASASEIARVAQNASDKSADRRLWNESNLGDMFSSLTEAVSGVPGGTLNFVDVTAMGGTKWGIAGSIDFGDQVTLRFRELSGMPVRKAIAAWANLIRHTNSGLSMLSSNEEYTKTNWTADLTYWIMRPNGKSVEAGIVFQGIYPMSDLGSQINTDITSVDGQTFDVNFHVDAMYWDSNTTAKAQNLVNSYYETGREEYYNHSSM